MGYLEKYIEALELVELTDQRIIVVDLDSKFRYLSLSVKENYGVPQDNFKNLGYADLPSIAQIASLCINEDIECIKTLKTQKYITSQNHQGEIQIYLKQKTPLIDPQSRLAVGVRVDFFPIYSLGHFKPYINNYITKFDLLENAFLDRQKLNLTEVEELILFLLIMYLKPKVVNAKLNIILNKDVTVSTVRNIIHQQLLRKFNVITIDELINKAFFLGYDTILPRIMIKQFSIRIV